MVDYHIIIFNMTFMPKMFPQSSIYLVLNKLLSCISKSWSDDGIRRFYFIAILLARYRADAKHIIRAFGIIRALTWFEMINASYGKHVTAPFTVTSLLLINTLHSFSSTHFKLDKINKNLKFLQTGDIYWSDNI